MTTETQQVTATQASGKVHGNPWHPTFRGVMLATWIELLRRRPSTKGYVFYGLTFAAIIGLGVLAAVNAGPGKNSVAFELVLILILGAGMLIGPSLSATSINGDSSEGVLAPLQMTRLSAGDLTFGKLLASWLVCLAALVTTTPLLVYSYGRSGWHVGEALTVVATILLVVLAFTAVGLAWSSIAARAVASVSLTHLTTGVFVLGTLLIFAFTMPLVSEDVTVINRDKPWEELTDDQMNDPEFIESLECVDIESIYTINHTDKTAWMLLANPVVVIAETAPVVNPETYEQDGRAAPGLFAMIHKSVSGARLGPMMPQAYDACADEWGDEEAWAKREMQEYMLTPNPVPGIAIASVLLVGSLWIVVRRLRVPYKKLRSGTRVA